MTFILELRRAEGIVFSLTAVPPMKAEISALISFHGE
jgi:hypothetical protein